MEQLGQFLNTFAIFHINAFYAILYFLKDNFFFMFVLFAIGYMIVEELKSESYQYVNDNRRII